MSGGKKHFRQVEQFLTGLGYEASHQNANSCWVYTQQGREDVPVSPGLSEPQARTLMRRLRRVHGIDEGKTHRNASAVKERQARDRAALKARVERLEADRARIVADKARWLPADLAREIERIDAERREIEQLMAAPVVGSHLERRATHQAGAR